MAPSYLCKQTADRESSHDWLMSLAMDLAACVTYEGENGTNGSHLAVFSEDVAFACHFIAPHPPHTLPPYRSASVWYWLCQYKNYLNGRKSS